MRARTPTEPTHSDLPPQPTPPRGRRWQPVLAVLPLLFALISARAQDDARALLPLINAYRDAPRDCDGERRTAAGPLAPDASLARVAAGSGRDLQGAMKAEGYLAATATLLTAQGPGDAAAAMRFLKTHACKALLDGAFAEVGVHRRGDRWRLVLARPLLSPDLPDWRAAGRAILEHTNAARASAQRCGDQAFDAAPPLTWNGELAEAARAHSRSMARRNRFAHRGPDGEQVGSRARDAGYAWQRVGENIAAGQGSAAKVTAGWLASPQHCVNVMNPDFQQMGAAYEVAPQSDGGIYWTQVFGTPK